ncbi:MAG: Plug domain-containing protein [Acidobacteriaceae bacterium]
MTIKGGTSLINTESATVSTVIDRRFVENLPLNGRSFNTLLQLTPGVVIAPSNNMGGNPGQFSVAGQRTDANSFSVDGVSANFGVSVGTDGYMGAAGTGSAQAFSVLGGSSSLVSVDALQEFRVETSSFAPEFGRQPGGQVILTTRSGTNDFNGGIFDYFRNTVMDANNWFANQAKEPRAPEHHNDFGGFLGGPLRKDRTFFFASYEGARLDEPETTQIEVPSSYARATAPTNLAPFLNAYPLPGDTTVVPGVYTSPFTGNYASRATLNAGSIRIDHTISDRFSIFGRYNEAPSSQQSPTLSLSTLQSTVVNTRTLTYGLNAAFGKNVSNAYRGNYSAQTANTAYTLTSYEGAAPLSSPLLIGSLSATNTLGSFAPLDTAGADLQFGPAARNHAGQNNFVDDLSWAKGTHQIKIGGDYRLIETSTAPPGNTVAFDPTSVQSFLATGDADLVALTSGSATFHTQALSLFAQDGWKIGTRTNVTYGLRWDVSPAPAPTGDTRFATWQNLGNPSEISLAPLGNSLWETSYENVAPRIGIAYALTSNGDTVIRAGAGIFYDLGLGQSANVATTFPNGVLLSSTGVSLPVSDLSSYLPIISLEPPYGGLIYAFEPDLKTPRSYEWNIALEKLFARQQTLSVTYVGQTSRDLLRNEALTTPNANFAPGSFLYVTQSNSSSNYNALQVQLRRPLANGFQALLNYTYSHSLDDTSDDTVSTISSTVYSNKNDWGSSSFDVRQSFSGALFYEIPSAARSGPIASLTGGWSVDAVAVARSGFPFNLTLLTLGAIGGAYPRPDIIPGRPLWVSAPGAPAGKMVNPLAFAVPSTLRQGTEARNDIPGLGFTQPDFSLARKFKLGERVRLQFRADAFNAMNHPNFTNPPGYYISNSFTTYLQSISTLNEGLGGLNPLFQEGGPRSLQLSLRLSF